MRGSSTMELRSAPDRRIGGSNPPYPIHKSEDAKDE